MPDTDQIESWATVGIIPVFGRPAPAFRVIRKRGTAARRDRLLS
jgi:hypothetical protein